MSDKKPNKTAYIRFVLTEEEKKRIEDYAEERGLSISSLARMAIKDYMNKE